MQNSWVRGTLTSELKWYSHISYYNRMEGVLTCQTSPFSYDIKKCTQLFAERTIEQIEDILELAALPCDDHLSKTSSSPPFISDSHFINCQENSHSRDGSILSTQQLSPLLPVGLQCFNSSRGAFPVFLVSKQGSKTIDTGEVSLQVAWRIILTVFCSGCSLGCLPDPWTQFSKSEAVSANDRLWISTVTFVHDGYNVK